MPPLENERLSVLSPAGLKMRLVGLAERRLPVRWLDEVNHFLIQTRLLFSRFVLLLLAAMFFFFTWATVEQQTFQEENVFGFLLMQTIGLAIILHMSLWEGEREERTFEFLVMRVPNVHSLIWFKLRVSLLWTFILLLPFFFGFVWFVSIPFGHALLFLLFCSTHVLFFSLLTCVVASFVHRALPTGIIVVIATSIYAGFSENAPLPYRDYYRTFLYPFSEAHSSWGTFDWVRLIVVNRLVEVVEALGFYTWFARRLSKTEKWIG